MMILKCLAAAFVLYLIAVFIVAVIGGIIQKVRKKARHRRTTIPVRDASAPVAANSVQRNRTLSAQEHPSSVATGQRGQRAGRQAPAGQKTSRESLRLFSGMNRDSSIPVQMATNSGKMVPCFRKIGGYYEEGDF